VAHFTISQDKDLPFLCFGHPVSLIQERLTAMAFPPEQGGRRVLFMLQVADAAFLYCKQFT